MLKKILLIILLIFILPFSTAIVSRESFYSAGSDFLVITNPLDSIKASPKFFALYDNTNIYFDINNDGANDYKFKVGRGGPYTFNTAWTLTDGTRVHSDKPISYVQSFYHYDKKCSNHPDSNCYLTRINVMPPISAYRNEYVLAPGTWNFVADGALIISIDEGMVGNAQREIIVNRTTSGIKINNPSKVYSENTFFAYSYIGFGGPLSDDFFSNEDNIMIIPESDDTTIYIDMNNDGNVDITESLENGMNFFDIIKGSRISSNKQISAFGYMNGSTFVYSGHNAYNPLPMSNSVTEEFIIDGTNGFFLSNVGNNIIGLFNPDSASGMTFDLELFDNDMEWTEYNNFMTSDLIGVNKNFLEGISTVPVLDNFFYYYNHGLYNSYQTGHKMAYKQVYLTAMPMSKYIEPNSTTAFNVRVINPFHMTDVSKIKVKFRFDKVSFPVASVNVRKADIVHDLTVDSFSKAVTISSDEMGSFFIFAYDDVLESQTYLDINFNLVMPDENISIMFEPAELEYKASTWII